MKNTLILLGLTAATALAGSSDSASTMSTASSTASSSDQTCLWTWFAGAGVDSGERYRFSSPFTGAEWTSNKNSAEYDLQLGAYSQANPGGFKYGFFFQGGWEQGTSNQSGVESLSPLITGNYSAKTDVIPVTLNAIFELPIVGGLNVFATVGAGPAFTHFHYSADFSNGTSSSGSKNSVFFYPQASLGLSYDFTRSFSIYADTRWIGLDGNVNYNGNEVEDFRRTLTLEGGLRWKF